MNFGSEWCKQTKIYSTKKDNLLVSFGAGLHSLLAILEVGHGLHGIEVGVIPLGEPVLAAVLAVGDPDASHEAKDAAVSA